MAAIADRDALRQFTENIRTLVDAGYGARAVYLLREAARVHGFSDLAAAADPATVELEISGWDHLLRDCAIAASPVSGGIHLTLTIVGRTMSSPDREQGVLNRSIQGLDGDHRVGVVPDNTGQTTRLGGLDQLFALLRAPSSSDLAGFDRELRDELCKWLIASYFVQAVKQRCERDPLPAKVALVLGADFTPRSMECGFLDLLPHFSCRFEPALVATPNAAEEMRTERRAEHLEAFQKIWEDDFAERREIHRMLGFFPFYRGGGRDSLGEFWEHRLTMTCEIVGADPGRKISWRMSPGELTQILRRIAMAKNVPDIEGALDTGHTDRLHDKWLDIAKAANFKLGAGTSMFQLELAAVLQKGGPWVADRWERAKLYRAD